MGCARVGGKPPLCLTIGDVVGEGHSHDGGESRHCIRGIMPVDVKDAAHKDHRTNQAQHRPSGYGWD
jgi:hypothetical protein